MPWATPSRASVYTPASPGSARKQPDSYAVAQTPGESQHSLALLENSTALKGTHWGGNTILHPTLIVCDWSRLGAQGPLCKRWWGVGHRHIESQPQAPKQASFPLQKT